jgi:hypothetical protein
MPDHQRRDDDLVPRIDQKLTDFIAASKEWQTHHDETSKEWRESIDKRIDPIEAFVGEMKTYQRAAVVIVAAITGLITMWPKILSFLRSHF